MSRGERGQAIQSKPGHEPNVLCAVGMYPKVGTSCWLVGRRSVCAAGVAPCSLCSLLLRKSGNHTPKSCGRNKPNPVRRGGDLMIGRTTVNATFVAESVKTLLTQAPLHWRGVS